MTDPTYAIRAERLSKSVDGRFVLRDIEFKLALGECVALTGDNGSGKTTFLRCLAALTRPTEGNVYWLGRPAAESPEQKKLVGMVTHAGRMYAHLSLRENLLFAARMSAILEPVRRVQALLAQVGLDAIADQLVCQISKGTRQRLALVRALVHDPPILLLDEPFSGLDATSQDWLTRLLEQLRADGRAICLTTHDRDQTRLRADRLLILRRGSLTDPHAIESGMNRDVPRYAA